MIARLIAEWIARLIAELIAELIARLIAEWIARLIARLIAEWIARLIAGKGDNGTADAADKGVDHGAQQGAIVLAGGGSQGQPQQDFGFGDRAIEAGFELLAQVADGAGLAVEQVGELVGDFVGGEVGIEVLGPGGGGDRPAGDLAIEQGDVGAVAAVEGVEGVLESGFGIAFEVGAVAGGVPGVGAVAFGD